MFLRSTPDTKPALSLQNCVSGLMPFLPAVMSPLEMCFCLPSPAKSEMARTLPALKTHVKCHREATWRKKRGQVPASPLPVHTILGSLSPHPLPLSSGVNNVFFPGLLGALITGWMWRIHYKVLNSVQVCRPFLQAAAFQSQPRASSPSFKPPLISHSSST